MSRQLLINCDMGECLSPDVDATLMPLIDMANIACGGHAGNQASMQTAVELARRYGVATGAHPSYQDIKNFGRISHSLQVDTIKSVITTQVTAFKKICEAHNSRCEYVKPHGALYHDMMQNPAIFINICSAIQAIDASLALVVPAGLPHPAQAIKILYEVFADRAYQGLQLVPRGQAGAVLNKPQAIVKQYQQFLGDTSQPIHTICFHGDNPASVEALTLITNV